MAKLNTDEFIRKARLKHLNRYDYSEVFYINNELKITIICHAHGLFRQKPGNHLKGNGCGLCKISKGENEINNYLQRNKIIFKRQHIFPDCKKIRSLPFDFYLPKQNLCIEFDGRQHTQSIDVFGGERGFQERIVNDEIKNLYCRKNEINLLRISYKDSVDEKLEKYLK